MSTRAWTGDKTDGATGRQDQNYGKGTNMANHGTSKALATKSLPMIKGGAGVTHDSRGSAQSYPKGSKVSLSANWNPQKIKASQFGIKGV